MISSVVIRANAGFKSELRLIEGATLEKELDGRFIVLIEASSSDENIAIFAKLQALPSVIDINLTFTECEDFSLMLDAYLQAEKVNNLADDAAQIKYFANPKLHF